MKNFLKRKITICPICGHDFEKIIHYSIHPIDTPLGHILDWLILKTWHQHWLKTNQN